MTNEFANYVFGDLGLCVCGEPSKVLTAIRDVLKAIKTQDRHAVDTALNMNSHALRQAFLYYLDDKGLTEHGTRVEYARLTDEGENLLAQLIDKDLEKFLEIT